MRFWIGVILMNALIVAGIVATFVYLYPKGA